MTWTLVGNIMGPPGPQGPPGTGGGTAGVIGETPGGAIDGSNTVFTSGSAYQALTLAVYLNGLRQRRTDDYTEASATSFTFALAPRSTDSISIDYYQATAPVTTVVGEIPLGAFDGVNKTFTTSFLYVPNGLSVFLDGIRLRRTADYTETGSTTFQLLSAPLPGDTISVDYQKQ